ncbi:Protein of unknown function [Pyronema omphalodes CBS 100304]|uniref:Uncharacterized protein n=1 Tax=Pyronema omphalodes (strain CBS 100304) TaxID=1076935 RepID=U4LHD4_PYROM|nr:Protein of unknown function [Pyronema omphalodes CBS 100304]
MDFSPTTLFVMLHLSKLKDEMLRAFVCIIFL